MSTKSKITEAAEAAGWGVYHTGGGCMALRFPAEGVGAPEFPHFLATEWGGSEVPAWGDDIILGMFRSEDDEGVEIAFTLEYSNDCDGLGTAGYTIHRTGADDPRAGDGDPLDGMAIHDPMVDEAQSYGAPVDPEARYGVPAPVAALQHYLYRLAVSLVEQRARNDDALINDAVDAMFAHVQEALGVTDGGYAATVYGGRIQDQLTAFLRDYIDAERANVAAGMYRDSDAV
jgi:hypothetical protein